MPKPVSERAIIFLVGAVQFINILDFMMVMPLGPDFAGGLGIATSNLGLIGGSYTAAACVAGIAGAFFLDRFDRRSALAVAMLGLCAGTAAGGLATGLWTLLAARVIAGAFGGPATSIALSIIADVIPPERRGKAIGAVMGAFSIASVLGVPAGLELARLGSFRTPFFVVAAVGLAVTAGTMFFFPSMTGHLDKKSNEPDPTFVEILERPVAIISLAMTAVLMLAAFILIPNISAYLQYNLNYPRARLGLLYSVGGAVSFFTMRLYGRMVDRWGSFRVGLVGSIFFVAVEYSGFYAVPPIVPIMVVFVCFMASASMRTVPYNTLVSKVPSPRERARFLSIQSAVQHLASALGAFLSTKMLSEKPSGELVGMRGITLASMCTAALLPVFLWLVERRVPARPAATAPVTPPVESTDL